LKSDTFFNRQEHSFKAAVKAAKGEGLDAILVNEQDVNKGR